MLCSIRRCRPRFGLAALAFLLAVVSLESAIQAAAIRMAVMGDSISANTTTKGYAPVWVTQLTKTGAVTAQNKALGGVTSAQVVSSQLPSVIGFAQKSQIDDSVLIVGGNDLTANNAAVGLAIAAGGSPTAFINSYFNNVKAVLDGVKGANSSVRQVFGNIPDITVTPQIQGLGIDPAALQLLSNAIGQANAKADQYAISQGIPILDFYTASHSLLSNSPQTLGGHTFPNSFAPDGYHPSPAVQGLIANMVAWAFNKKYGQSMPYLSDQQIVTNAGFTPNSETTYFDISLYVIVPEPSSAVLAAIACVWLAAFGWRRRSSQRRAA